MRTAERPYVAAGLALATASTIAVAPIMPALPEMQIPTVRAATQLTSIFDVFLNLFQDIVNVPYNMVEASSMFGEAQIWGGVWTAASGTNLWGEDPGDVARFMALVDFLVPFKQISGQGDPVPGYVDPSDPANNFSWTDAAAGHLGLSQQFTLFQDAMLPASATSDATWSAPLLPVSPITGSTGIDRLLWELAIGTGLQKYPLTSDWYQVSLKDLTNGYTFPTVVNPSAGVGPDGAVPTDTTFGFAGTMPGGASSAGGTLDPQNLMPWSGGTFKLDLLYPFQNFLNSLNEPVDFSTYFQGFHLASLTDFAYALQNQVAGFAIAFDLFVPGSPLCPGDCTWGVDFLKGEVNLINQLWIPPGQNPALNHWLDLVNTPSTGPGGLPNPFGSANGPTGQQVNSMEALFSSRQNAFDFGNPQPDSPPSTIETPAPFQVGSFMQGLIDFYKNTGLLSLDEWVAKTFFGWTPSDGIDYSTNNWWLDPPAALAATDATAAATAADPTEHVGLIAQVLDALGLGAA